MKRWWVCANAVSKDQSHGSETTCVLGLEPMCVCAPLSVRVLSTLFVCGAL